MATPTPMKHALSQQGRTPSQSQHGAAATPPVSTPFSMAHAAFSPHGPRSSPQQMKKSPATVTIGGGHPSVAAVNFDSPSAAAALSGMQMGSGLEMGLQGLVLGRTSEDEKAKRLDGVINILSQSKGLVSEAGLERLARRLGLETMEEPSMTGDGKKTLIVAGAALELLIEFSNNTVTGVTLGFPESAEIVNKHAVEAGKILLKDLQIEHNQSPLTKSLEPFARNFERLALLDKLSINPGLNLYEAVAGIYESLQRLHNWELHKSREDPSLTGKSDLELALIALCTKSGRPSMNGRGRVGLSLDFWTEKRLQPYPTPEAAAHAAETNKTWSLLIGCAPLREMGANPVRITDKWISLDVASGPTIDWLEPEPTFVPAESQTQTGPLQPGSPMMPGPRLPEAVFQATFDPPLHISLDLWNRIIDFGCGLDSSHHKFVMYDSLVIPAPTSKANEQTDTRTVICTKKVQAAPVGQPAELTHKTHTNTLYVYDAVPGKTLTELTFSHPSQLVQLLPYLRQYAFLSILLENSFKDDSVTVSTTPASAANKGATSSVKSDTNQDDFRSFMRGSGQQNSKTQNDAVPKQEGKEESLKVDVTLTVLPVPRLQVVFPFRDKTANILVEIRENGHVHVEAQNVLDESNMNATQNGRQRRVEDIGGLLMYMEDIGKWAEFIRTRWA